MIRARRNAGAGPDGDAMTRPDCGEASSRRSVVDAQDF